MRGGRVKNPERSTPESSRLEAPLIGSPLRLGLVSVPLAGGDGVLDLADGLGDFDLAGTSQGAVEGGAAAPHPHLFPQLLQPRLAGLVAAVEDEAVGLHDGR